MSPSYSALRAEIPRRLRILAETEPEEERVEHFRYKQDLERRFTVTLVVALGFLLMGVPFGLLLTLWIALVDGGNATMLYGWVVVALMLICVVVLLSEIALRYPTLGGVYHFSALLSSARYLLVSSWFTGWFLLVGSWTYCVSIMFSGLQFMLLVVGIRDAYYKEDIWYVLAVYFVLLAGCGLVNFKCQRHLETINRMCIVWLVVAVAAIDVLLLVFSPHTNPIGHILTSFDNLRLGWPDAVAFVVGWQSALFTLTGYGMLFLVTDEVKRPERNMPKGATLLVCILALFGLVFILPLLTILPTLLVLLDDTPEIMPISLVFKTLTQLYVVLFLLVVLLVGTVVFQLIGLMMTALRTTYAFARDGGLPGRRWWTEIDAVDHARVPKNALFLVMGVCAVLLLLALVSTLAFNAFMGALVVSLLLANGMPILCLLLNRRQKIKGAHFRLRWGLGCIINAVSLAWVVLLSMILCLPPVVKNLTPSSMNYASAVFTGFAGLATLGYIWWGVSSFEGPQIDSDYFELNRAEAAQEFELDEVPELVEDADRSTRHVHWPREVDSH